MMGDGLSGDVRDDDGVMDSEADDVRLKPKLAMAKIPFEVESK